MLDHLIEFVPNAHKLTIDTLMDMEIDELLDVLSHSNVNELILDGFHMSVGESLDIFEMAELAQVDTVTFHVQQTDTQDLIDTAPVEWKLDITNVDDVVPASIVCAKRVHGSPYSSWSSQSSY